MLFFSRKPRPRITPSPRRTFLGVERLETRDCPSGPASNTNVVVSLNGSPTMSLSVTPETGKTVLLAGSVSGNGTQGCSVSFSGVASGSVGTDDQGNYSYETDASALGTITAAATDSSGNGLASAQATLSIAVPNVILAVSWGTGEQATVSGQVANYDPASCSVALGGVIGGSATPDAQGNFSYTFTATKLGEITATATDVWKQESDPASVDLTTDAPTVTMSVGYGGHMQVALSGHVTGQDPHDTPVSFSGVVTGTVYPDANGDYTFTTTATGKGQVTAVATDPWCQASSDVTLTLPSAAPQIVNFGAQEFGDHIWLITGTVVGDDLAGVTLTLGGLPCVNGKTPIVDDNGNFECSVTMGDNENGTLTAVATDDFGQTSDTATNLIRGN